VVPETLRDVIEVIELLLMRPICALDMAVQTGRPRREHKELDPQLGTGCLEGGLKLRAAVDLDRRTRNPKRAKASWSICVAAALVVRGETASTSLRQTTSRAAKWIRRMPGRTSTGLVSISFRSPGRVPSREPLGLRPRPAPSPPPKSAPHQRRVNDVPPSPQAREGAADRRDGHRAPFPPQHHGQLGFPLSADTAPELPGSSGRPPGASGAAGPAAAAACGDYPPDSRAAAGS